MVIPNTETYWRTQMGQAFDEQGKVLGEAFGHTKGEVFEKLMAEHPDAAEIRIRTRGSALGNAVHAMRAARTQLPKYRCHKEVWALKIAAIEHYTDGAALLSPAEHGYLPFCVSAAYVRKHDPKSGGYFVVYQDGYQSFSPATAFEEGYSRI